MTKGQHTPKYTAYIEESKPTMLNYLHVDCVRLDEQTLQLMCNNNLSNNVTSLQVYFNKFDRSTKLSLNNLCTLKAAQKHYERHLEEPLLFPKYYSSVSRSVKKFSNAK